MNQPTLNLEGEKGKEGNKDEGVGEGGRSGWVMFKLLREGRKKEDQYVEMRMKEKEEKC